MAVCSRKDSGTAGFQPTGKTAAEKYIVKTKAGFLGKKLVFWVHSLFNKSYVF